MKDISDVLDAGDRKYRLVFNLNVLQEIQEKYGTFDKWIELVSPEGDGEPDTAAVIFAFTCMMNEGIDIENEEKGTSFPPVTQRQAGRIITKVGLIEALDILTETVSKSTEPGEQAKNE